MSPKFIEINGKKIGNFCRPYIIAEMACAHQGSFEKAKKLIDASKEAGADAVQLQFFTPDHTVTPQHEAYKILLDLAFSQQQWAELCEHARNHNIDVWACTYDEPSVDWAQEFKVDGIKLNSADLSNPFLIKKVVHSKIPFTLGTGASTIEEIAGSIRSLQEWGAKNYILMHGVQNFPTDIPNLNINRLKLLHRQFPDKIIGYADHTQADLEFALYADFLALALGAALIEKHIHLDRTEKGVDYQSALNPQEYLNFVRNLRLAYEALGPSEEQPLGESELKYRKFQKKSIVAARVLEEGSIVQDGDFMFLRNESPGLAPAEINSVVGKKVIKKIGQFENIETAHLEGV